MRERFKEALVMKVMQLNRFEYKVVSKGNNVVVDFDQRCYSCHVFDLDRLPCVHAIATNEQVGMQIYDMCSNNDIILKTK